MKSALAEKIAKQFPAAVHETAVDFDVFLVDVEDYLKMGHFLKSDPDLAFDHLSDLSGVDYLDYLEVVAHLYSYTLGHKIRIKTRVTREAPDVPSLTSLWSTAGWHEREAWDLYGIVFTGHPDLRRILSDDDQPGHPYRKDVPLENDEAWVIGHERPLKDYGLPEEWES
jgi:NADH-quinone oxidoreductase subunit C